MKLATRLALPGLLLLACADPVPPAVAPSPPPPAPPAAPPAATVAASPFDDPALRSVMSSIRPETIRAHMAFLADDALEGRGVGARGYDVAAKYVAAEFQALGLLPAGAGGNSYMQPVPLRRVEVDAQKTTASCGKDHHERALKFGEDFVSGGDPLRQDSTVDAPAVFVGYGVTAPDQRYDDYAGLDVRGKVIVGFYGAPSRFPSEQRAYYSDGVVKARNAVAHGAVGFAAVLTPDAEKRWPWKWNMPQIKAPGFRWLDSGGVPNDTFTEMRGRCLLNQSGAEALFAGAPKTLEQAFTAAAAGTPGAFPLPSTLRIHTVTRHTAVTSPNIIAALPGSDPKLRDEYVIFTAHLDHLGVREPIDGDAIYNGAVDNASGVAVLLTLARAFRDLSPAPKRSLLFAVVTGEESGLLGSDYFAHFPTVPRASLVANVNIDGAAGILYPIADIVPLGAEHSSLGTAVGEAARRFGIVVSRDPMPEEVFFIRSDQYSFVKQGIPAVMISEGVKTADPKLDGAEIMKKWMSTLYHTPKDDMSQAYDFASAARTTQLNMMIGYGVAQATERVTWNRGDFFGEKFGNLTPLAPRSVNGAGGT